MSTAWFRCIRRTVPLVAPRRRPADRRPRTGRSAEGAWLVGGVEASDHPRHPSADPKFSLASSRLEQFDRVPIRVFYLYLFSTRSHFHLISELSLRLRQQLD